MTLGTDLFGGDEAVESAARSEIDNALPRAQRALRKRITDAGKSLDRAFRHPGHKRLVVSQSSRQRASCMEMKDAVRIDGDIAIFGLDLIAERQRINW